jgi:hypothetical protein
MMIGMTIDGVENSARALRTAALGALVFDVPYVVHRLLQGLGPDDATPAGISGFNLAPRSALLASGRGRIGAAGRDRVHRRLRIPDPAGGPGRSGHRRHGERGGVRRAGFISQAAETALLGVANAGDQSAVLALNHLQGRMPIVWTITALTAAVSLAGLGAPLLPTWLGVAGLLAAGVFALGSMSSVLGRTIEGNSSLFGVGLFVVWLLWLLLVALCLWRAAGRAAPESGAEHQQ